MSLNRRIRSITATGSNQVLIPKCIWISDDILDRALQRLFRPQCPGRHGSSVPGPLEFRRRATKRRIMGLVPAGGSSPGADPGLLAPLRKRNPQDWQWQSPRDTRPAPKLPSPVHTILPEWLTRPNTEKQKSKTRPEFELTLNDGPADSVTKLSNRRKSLSLADFLAALDSCTNFKDIQRLALDRPFATNPLHSHAAFRHLLKQDPSMDLIIKFLENPKMHSAESRNLLYLVATQMESEMMDKAAVALFARWIGRQIALGLLSPAEILSLFTTVTDCINDKTRKVLSYLKISRYMWRGMNNCPFYYRDVRIRAFYYFFQDSPPCRGSMSPAARRLGLEVVQSHFHTDSVVQQHCLHEFIKTWHVSQNPHVLGKDLSALKDKGSSLLGLLKAFPSRMVKHCLRDASTLMLNYLLGTDSDDNMIVDRIRLFRTFGFKTSEDFAGIKTWENVESTLAQKGVEVVSSYVAHMDPHSLCIFVLKHRYTLEVCQELNTDCSSLSSSLLSKFEELTLREPRQEPFLNLLLTIQSFEYPFPIKFQTHLLDLLRARGMLRTICILLVSPKLELKFYSSLVMKEIRYRLSRGQNLIAYNIFRGYKIVTLRHVPELAEAIIKSPSLECRTALKLHRYRTRRNGGQIAFISQYPLTVSRVEVYNRMAHAYATAAHLSPRAAFRMVYHCYCACVREKLPVTPAITRALVLAGCIRYLKEWRWVSTVRFGWILKRVHEVEGAEVADEVNRMAFQWRELMVQRRSQLRRQLAASRSGEVEEEGH